MTLRPPTWAAWFDLIPDIPRERLLWWLSDRLDLSLTQLPLQEAPSPGDADAFDAARIRLRAGEPVQYVCGRVPFRGLVLDVTPNVLIPRPETEQLVQWALDRFLPHAARVLDVGTGSGCIALSLKQERPDLEVHGTDCSTAALRVAERNANQADLEVEFHPGDLLRQEPEQAWDVVIANLPYVGEAERAALPAEVRDWEPGTALFSGPDGTDAIRDLLLQAPLVLRPGGSVLLETGETHTPFLTAFARDHGWDLLSARDLAGRERFHALKPTASPTTAPRQR